jgi:Ca2+-binding EF-hand superfamily protein
MSRTLRHCIRVFCKIICNIEIFIKTFKSYDKNGDGVMDQSEFKNIMIDLGFRKITDEKVKELLEE